MQYSVYIIYSAKLDKYYVGYTENIALRLTQHNEGQSTFTSNANDWLVKYVENFNSRKDAHKRELEIKRKKSRKYIEWLISSVSLNACPESIRKEVVPALCRDTLHQGSHK
jgi:putative endonuclease